jgi:hypothetical protein
MTARISARIGIDPDQAKSPLINSQACLHLHFTMAGSFDRLPNIYEAARKRIATRERITLSTDKQHWLMRIEHDAIRHERWRKKPESQSF